MDSNAQAGTGVNTVITADVDPSALTNNGVFDFSEDPIQFDDLAGNVTEIDGFTLIFNNPHGREVRLNGEKNGWQ